MLSNWSHGHLFRHTHVHTNPLFYDCVSTRSPSLCHMFRVGQNHIYTVCIRYFLLGNHQIYGVYIRIYMVMANPTHVMFAWVTSTPHTRSHTHH
jgi:hypothetical protein